MNSADADLGQGGAKSLIESERTIMLAKYNSIYLCSRYNDRSYDWDGNYQGPGTWAQYASPQLASAGVGGFVPLSNRRPSNPYRLGKLVVDKFTAFIFNGDCPVLHCIGDQDTEDFAKAIGQVADIPTKLIQARTMGGSCGTVGLSWSIKNGKPQVRVHNAQFLHVHEWVDRENLIPAVVSEIYKYSDFVWDEEKKQVITKQYWHRRTWTKVADVVFRPLEVDSDDPNWDASLDEDASHIHGDGFCHFIWVQNKPSTEVDGYPDYFGVEEQLGELDVLNSLMSRALRKNLDPTLVLKMPGGVYGRAAIQKGSDSAIVLDSASGTDAKYLELTGTSITVGTEKLKLDTQHILDVVQCVLHDPSEIAAQGLSGAAIRLILGPMIAAGYIYREQYGRAFRTLMEQIIASIQVKTSKPRVLVMPDGSRQPVNATLDLPPKEDEQDTKDVDGDPDHTTDVEEYKPGSGKWFNVVWKPFVEVTTQEKTQLLQAFGQAVLATTLSQQTAVEQVAKLLEVDQQLEWKRVSEETQKKQQQQSAMTPGIGGQVPGTGGMPPGAQARQPRPPRAPGAGGAGPKPPSAPMSNKPPSLGGPNAKPGEE